MAKSLLPTMILIAGVCAAPTCAAQGGLNLAWDDCLPIGSTKKHFGCETNEGPPYLLYGSFFPPATLTRLVGLAATVEVYSSAATLPSWWTFGAGGCRADGALKSSFDFELGPYGCQDIFGAPVTAGHALEILAPDRARLRLGARWDLESEVLLDHQYFAFRLELSRAATTGAGACMGCEIPVCFLFSELTLIQPPEENFDPMILNPAWNHAAAFQSGWLFLYDHTPPECKAEVPVPVRHSTWGAVRALYR